MNDSFKDSFNFATFSNASDIAYIAILNDITDRKSTLPTILNANPIANTATAIRRIVPIPFLRELSDFLSPPASSKIPVFLSFSFFFEISNIVFCCLNISCVSFLIDLTSTLISLSCPPKSPLVNAEPVAELGPPLLDLPFFRAAAISSNESDKLFNAFNNILSIKNFQFRSIYKNYDYFL